MFVMVVEARREQVVLTSAISMTVAERNESLSTTKFVIGARTISIHTAWTGNLYQKHCISLVSDMIYYTACVKWDVFMRKNISK